MIVAVDMTNYIPGGANGGIVPLTISTIQGLVKRGDISFVLLTTGENHDALSIYDSPQISRRCMTPLAPQHAAEREAPPPPAEEQNVSREEKLSLRRRIYLLIRRLCIALAPEFVYQWAKRHRVKLFQIKTTLCHPVERIIKPIVKALLPHKLLHMIWQYRANRKAAPLPPQLDVGEVTVPKYDLLYCPFTAVNFYDADVPVVSTLHDIQHVYCPWFFADAELQHRDQFYHHIIDLNPTIISVSEFSRKTFIESYHYPPEKIITIHSAVQGRLNQYPASNDAAELESLHLSHEQFLFYPANFWRHKNHRGLLTAFSMFLHANPDSPLKLVLTGFPVDGNAAWVENIDRMGLSDRVLCLGYVSDASVAALFRSCEMMIFPSFFEGFGMPVTEAMELGATVLCSNVTSLPEVGGDCAFYFDPYDPADICRTIEYVLAHPEEVQQKKAKYRQWLQNFSSEQYMEHLVTLFRQLANKEVQA